ncbi:trichohyalin isoform X10 [Acanthochromis polyacanthus]|uniref:trichohyalin isoform X10 n=1 Tax=Acanthochromis polyacanthus TaxID=80966 RepID=UPI002234322A|nr:trichohyalin isoform X10 [Acanthochromis polyacanthus]
METKRPSCSLLDSNVNMSDHKLQPGGRISRDPSPRPAMTAQSDREEVRRSESQAVKMRDKVRYKDVETMERLYERERRRDGERRERRPEEDRGRNGRPLSNQEKEAERDVRRGPKKGDTFPRVKKDNRRMTPSDERGERRPRRGDEEGWDRTWYRDEVRPRDRNQESDLRGQDWRRDVEVRAREEGRRREREVRVSSPHRRRDREVHSDRREKREGRRDTRSEGDSEEREMRRETAKREEVVYQNSRSEGDDKRDREREEDRARRRADRQRRTERQEDRYDRKEDRYDRKEDRYDRKEDRYDRKEDRYDRKEDRKEDRYDRKEDRKEDRYDRKEDRYDRKEDRYDRKEDRKEDRYDRKEDRYDRKDDRKEVRYDRKEVRYDRKEDRKEDRYDRNDRKEERYDRKEDRYDRKEERYDRKEERKEDDAFRRQRTDRDRVPPKPPPRAQSSGEWSSDSESRFRRDQDRRDLERRHEGRSEGGRGEATGGASEQRRMWLEPQRNTREPSVDRERHARQKESRMEAEEKKAEEGRYRGGQGETEGVSVDGEEVQERHPSNSEGEERDGSDYWARSEDSEGGSDADWRQERDRMLSGEDGFVTVSSSGDREDEEDEEFVDCQEFWDVRDDSPGEEEETKYGFCVTGQTLPRSQAGQTGVDEASLETRHDDLRRGQHPNTTQEPEEPLPSELQEPRVILRSKPEHPYDEVGTIKRDSQTERLLKEWRQKNKDPAAGDADQTSPLPRNPYADVGSQVDFENIQPILDQIKSGAMSPEEVEAIRIRMSGAWSMSEEPKRHSQAPHLKWAKNVIREILGRSEETGVDEPNTPKQPEPEEEEEEEEEEEAAPDVQLTPEEDQSEEELEGLRGTRSSRAVMHVEQQPDMHVKTNTPLETDRQGGQAERKDLEGGGEEVAGSKRKEVEMFLSVSGTLYKPSSCPILNYEDEEEVEEAGKAQEVEVGVRQEVEVEGRQEVEVEGRQEVEVDKGKVGTLTSSCSFQDLGPEVRIRRRGIRKTTERRNGELVEVEEEEDEGVGRDRRTRIFSATDDEDDRSKSWGEVELKNVLDTIDKRRRNSKFFNAAQLYQQYSEAAQNFEILRQARSDILSLCEENSPAPSPPPARRPLPPLPPVPHPHSLSHSPSISSTQSLTLPEPPRTERRSSSPRLSISLSGQSASLWRELPGVRNSVELEELSEDQRRLQEVRFEVVTSEASYCRSLDIVVDHFVKSKQLGAKLTNQDRNWLFSRLADVRAISHSFLSKLEERVESDIMHFTVCDIIARHCQRFRMVYVPYLTNQSYQDATYQRLMNENQEFKQLVAKLERSPVCQRLPLRSFLVLPFQRITRIKLLVQNIVKRTTPGTAEALQAIKAMKLLEKLIQESNDSISQMKSIESLVSLSAKVDFECRTLPLVSQSRRLVREGPVTELIDFSLKDTERGVYLHLFNDYLLLSLQKEGGRFTVIDHSPVSDLRAENCRVKLHSLQKNLFRLHMSHKALLLRTDTQSDKLRWISALSRPHQEIDFSAAQDFEQMQCIRAFVAQQPDELSLEKADVILVHQQSSDNWVEGTRLSDRHRGWMPKSHLETISNSRVRQRNLSDALKLTTATAAV